MIIALDFPSIVDRQKRLREAVAKLADAMVAGEVDPSDDELRELALLCQEQFLVPEAARVRRWMTP